ncbi:piggyBac transposable element-derived protein 2-like [Aphis craccivora]|uniref:PiggyBac transposable element-derived protein 2-like n=1 Tax=Aphis craccivora TaxID=307492 RepID=A0A6G0VS74_APHCR|nr:piggyBac transposable element-derived protein 2-like [Aphis craccivora]
MNIINDDDIENFLNDIPSDGESFSGSEFDDSDNDKTYTPRISETIIHVSASSSDQGGSSDDECFYQIPTLPANPGPSRCSRTKKGNPIRQVEPQVEPFEPPYEPPLWGKSETMPSVELFSNDLDSGPTEHFIDLEDKSPYNIFCQIFDNNLIEHIVF